MSGSTRSSVNLRWFRIALVAFSGVVLVFLVMPTFVIFPMSFSDRSFLSFPPTGWSTQWYEKMVERPDYPKAFLNSLRVGIPVAIISTILGTMAALGAVRGQFRRGQVLSAMIIAPLMLPQIILAIGAYPVMVRLGIQGSYLAVIIAHTVICIPLVFITVTAALRNYPPTLEMAAMTLGANWFNTFWYVTFPMIRTGVIAGAILAFTFSFDELILALFLSHPVTRTLPLLLWEDLRFYLTPIVAAAASIVLVITFLLLSVIALLQLKRNRTP